MSEAGPWLSGWGLEEALVDRAGRERGRLRGRGQLAGAGPGSNRVGLQDAALSSRRWAVNKRGPGGTGRRAETARRPGAAGPPAARPSAGRGAAPVGVPGRARPASLSASICPKCSQRA